MATTPTVQQQTVWPLIPLMNHSLLSDHGSRSSPRSTKDQNFEFDDAICALAPHGSYKTRFDILICPGNYDPNHSTGPYFQFANVNITGDLNLTGNNIPDALKIGQNIHVIATVDDFNLTQELFHLTPVETRIR